MTMNSSETVPPSIPVAGAVTDCTCRSGFGPRTSVSASVLAAVLLSRRGSNTPLVFVVTATRKTPCTPAGSVTSSVRV
jgi:hypothetical protein